MNIMQSIVIIIRGYFLYIMGCSFFISSLRISLVRKSNTRVFVCAHTSLHEHTVLLFFTCYEIYWAFITKVT